MIEERAPNVGRLPLLASFIETKQYHRLVEVCEVCRQDRMIGVCSGDAGVGKTLSARRLTQGDQVERVLCSEAETLLEPRTLKIAFSPPEPLLSAKR
jgi:DNA transposition AAA+ family ATPase